MASARDALVGNLRHATAARPEQTTPSPQSPPSSPSILTPDSQDDMADAFNVLSHGALRSITEGNNVEQPILQCVQIKPMAQGQNGTERWRVVFNDTVNFIQGMIAQRTCCMKAPVTCSS